MSAQRQRSRFVLARAGIGLAATAVTTAVELPGRAIKAGLHLPANILGAGARGYLQLTHVVNDLAVRGDAVLGTVFPPREEQPQWATFDEDSDADAVHAGAAVADHIGVVDEFDDDTTVGAAEALAEEEALDDAEYDLFDFATDDDA